jgi:ribosomal protein S18 acetylase RimI-like enzyme
MAQPAFVSTDYDIIYREYQPEDSEQCIALENESHQHPTFYGMMHDGTIFGNDFDNKCRRYTEYVIVLGEAIHKQDPKKKIICACACLGLKNMYFNQQEVKSGFLFDLRVSDKFQKRGIGTKITNLLEEKAKAKECKFFYLSVNGSNKKAISLYEKTGYSMISERRITRQIIKRRPIEDRRNTKTVKLDSGKTYDLKFQRLDDDMDKVHEHYNKFYTNQDLAIKNFGEIFNTRGYLGTFGVSTSDNKNIVGISLFKSDTSNIFGVKKLVVPTTFYTYDWFYALGIAFMMPFVYLFTQIIDWILAFTGSSDFYRYTRTLFAFMFLSWLVTFFYHKFVSLVLHLSAFKPKGRLIGPFSHLEDEDLTREMFTFLLTRMKKVVSDHHIDNLTYNSDKNCRFLPYWSGLLKVTYKTFFMGRYIGDDVKLNEGMKSYQSTKHMFFDPRDL